MRKLAQVLVLFAAAIVAVIIVARYMGNSDLSAQKPVANSPASTPAATTPVQSVPETTPISPSSPVHPVKPVAGAVVRSAVQATNNLSVAQFLPAPQMKLVVEKLVLPSRRSRIEAAYAQTGPLLAQQLGYPGTNDVLVRANYFINTLKYKVDRMTGSNAIVRLYNLTHFVSSLQKEYWVPSITIVQLRRESGEWLYVRSYDPPASQMPLPRQNLNLQETEAAFQPYLKEFKTYASSE